MEPVLFGPKIDVETIVAAAGGLPDDSSQENLRHDLKITGHQFLLARMSEGHLSEKREQKLLLGIVKTSQKLASLLGELSARHSEPPNEHGEFVPLPLSLLHQASVTEFKSPRGTVGVFSRGLDALYGAVNGVLLIQRWSAAALEHPPADTEAEYEELGIPGIIPILFHEELGPKKGETAQSWLIGRRLPELYAAYFKRDFGISKPSLGGQPYGPGIRFVEACLTQWGVRKDPYAIEQIRPLSQTTWDIEPRIFSLCPICYSSR